MWCWVQGETAFQLPVKELLPRGQCQSTPGLPGTAHPWWRRGSPASGLSESCLHRLWTISPWQKHLTSTPFQKPCSFSVAVMNARSIDRRETYSSIRSGTQRDPIFFQMKPLVPVTTEPPQESMTLTISKLWFSLMAGGDFHRSHNANTGKSNGERGWSHRPTSSHNPHTSTARNSRASLCHAFAPAIMWPEDVPSYLCVESWPWGAED